MANPPIVNKAATIGDDIISGASSAGAQAIIILATADVPWLGLPVIKNLFSYIVGWICTYVSRSIQAGVTFAIIDAQVSSEHSDLSAAMDNLLAAEKSGDLNAIQKAIDQYATAHKALVASDGSAKPQ